MSDNGRAHALCPEAAEQLKAYSKMWSQRVSHIGTITCYVGRTSVLIMDYDDDGGWQVFGSDSDCSDYRLSESVSVRALKAMAGPMGML